MAVVTLFLETTAYIKRQNTVSHKSFTKKRIYL
jgi:hypothetical protein